MASLVFMGTPEFAVPSLKALIEAGHDIKAVVTQPDRPKGRGHILSPPPVKELALKKGIKVLQPTKLKDEGFVSELREHNPEFLIVVAYGRILPDEVLNIPTRAPINLHASLLPKYRGSAPIAWAIINGEKTTGVTTMIITKELDTGDVLLSEEVPIRDDDTTETLSKRLSIIGAPLLVKTISGMLDGSVLPKPQVGEPSYAPQIKKQDGKIHWDMPSRALFNFIRGMQPWPGAFTEIEKETITILRAEPIEGIGSPGRIEKIEKDSIVVGTGDGLIRILTLKPAHRRAMTAGEFIRGRKIKEGMSFR